MDAAASIMASWCLFAFWRRSAMLDDLVFELSDSWPKGESDDLVNVKGNRGGVSAGMKRADGGGGGGIDPVFDLSVSLPQPPPPSMELIRKEPLRKGEEAAAAAAAAAAIEVPPRAATATAAYYNLTMINGLNKPRGLASIPDARLSMPASPPLPLQLPRPAIPPPP